MAVDNLRAQLQLNEALRARTRLLQSQTQEMRSQVELSLELAAISTSESVDDMLDKLEELKDALADAREEAEELNETQGGLFDSIAKGAKKATGAVGGLLTGILGFASKAGAALVGFVGGVLSGLWSTFKSITATVWDFSTRVLKSLISGLWELSKAIIAIPFKIFSRFIEAASDIKVYEEMIRAIEKVRGAFGALNQTLGRDVMKTFRNMRGSMKDTSLSVGAALGFAHERLEFVTEIAKDMQSVFEVMSDVIVENAEEFAMYVKGMDLTGETMKSLGERAITFGKTIIDVGRDVNNMAQQMVGEGFAWSAKTVSKSMAQMIHDVGNFGTLTIREIGVSVVYFKQLGVEIEKIVGLVDGFDTFDDAAKRVSQLSQAFGVHVDVVKMMEAQNPADRANMLREAFFATGQTVENMTRQEQKLLAETMNLDVATSNLLFSRKNMGKSYDMLNRRAKQAEKSPMIQAKAMQKLADAIERIVHIMDPQKGGIFYNFFKGFEEGVMGKEFRFFTSGMRPEMMKIRAVLKETFMFGVKIGKMFTRLFPPMVKFREALKTMFDLGRWKRAFARLEVVFKEFFVAPTENMDILLKGLKRFVNDVIPVEVMDAFATAFKLLGKFVMKAAAKVFDYMLQGIAWSADKLAAFLEDPAGFFEVLRSGMQKGADAHGDAIERAVTNPFLKAWQKNEKKLIDAASRLWEAIKKPTIRTFNKVKDAIIDWAEDNGPIIGEKIIQFIRRGIHMAKNEIQNSIIETLDVFDQLAASKEIKIPSAYIEKYKAMGRSAADAVALGQDEYMRDQRHDMTILDIDIGDLEASVSESRRAAFAKRHAEYAARELRGVYRHQFNVATEAVKEGAQQIADGLPVAFSRTGKGLKAGISKLLGSIKGVATADWVKEEMHAIGTALAVQGEIDAAAKGKKKKKKKVSAAKKLSDAQRLVNSSTPFDVYRTRSLIKSSKYILRHGKNVEKAVKMVSGMNKLIKSATGFDTMPIAQIAGMVKEINAINEELDNLKGVNVVPKLVRLGNAIGGSGNYKINNKKFSIDIAVQVNIKGSDLAKAIARPLATEKFSISDKEELVTFNTSPAQATTGG